jgi:signal transduction histidine kinase
MQFKTNKTVINGVLLFTAFVIVSSILWNTYSFFNKFKEEERNKMEIWATAQSELLRLSEHQELGNLHLEVLQHNKSTPMILVNADGAVKLNNLPDFSPNDRNTINRLITQFESENSPIKISYKGEILATLYYGNSEVLNQLKYYPIALLLIILLFGAVIFFLFKSNKASEQNRLWAGMARETAHQIGTPLTSLLGWSELLKSEALNTAITEEIDKDIERLQIITERFAQIGSLPKLEKQDVVGETREVLEYLKIRTSRLIDIQLYTDISKLEISLNKPLFHWTMENIIKNSIDAMKGEGQISVSIRVVEPWVRIRIKDTGTGIPHNKWKAIFRPGISSKKRGWGLGLSLVRRIVEDYHQGKVSVYASNESGTTLQILFRI